MRDKSYSAMLKTYFAVPKTSCCSCCAVKV